MAILKKNIWTLFYIILIIGIFILLAILYNVNTHIKNSYINEQENFVKVNSTAIYSTFLQHEMLLDILGDQLTQNENYKSEDKSKKILDDLLKLDSPIIAFGLAKPNGQLYVTSSNLKNIKKLPNLLEKKETKESFKYSLDKNYMVIGRTYFHKTLNSLIIPIRKAVKDKNGNTIAVMTAGINVNKAFHIPNSTFIFRDLDYYNQITDFRDGKDLKTYEKPIPQDYVNSAFSNIEKKYKQSISEIKRNEKVISIEGQRYLNKEPMFISAKFNNRYKLWVIEQTSVTHVYNKVIKESTVFVLIFLILFIILYLLFRFINNIEKQKNKALLHQANHDHLTNLNNRLYLSNNFDKLNSKKNEPFTLFFIDMDNFKSINDNYGHNYGDIILKEISLRLLSFKKHKDTLVRYSGDEFIFITTNTKKEKIKSLASQIIKRLSEPYFIEQYQFILGASIGISQFPLDGKSFDEVKRYADIAMYEAKKDKNTYCLFEDSIKYKYLQNSLIESELKKAIDKNEISMVYQPQVNSNEEVYGVEALVRWENKKLGFVPPDQFIKVAESSGMMNKLGSFIIKQSLLEIKQIQNLLNKEFQLSINISVKQFMEPNFYDNLFDLIEQIEFDKQKVTLEVTENVFIEDIDFILEVLNKIKEQNVKISLDDFGTGYSSLSLLKRLPIDELKIDKSFIDDILFNEDTKHMIESIISIGNNFNMTTLAEGIESKEQKEELDKLDCNLYQGYYYSKPLKKEDLIEYLKNKEA